MKWPTHIFKSYFLSMLFMIFLIGDLTSGEPVANWKFDEGYTYRQWTDDHPDNAEVSSNLLIYAGFEKEDGNLNHKYYVSVSGSDENDGSKENPWATITYGSGKLFPGDTLIVESGIYREAVVVTNSGTEGKYITIRGEEGVIVNGDFGYDDSEYGLFTIQEAGYVVVEGITVKNSLTHGIKVFGPCKHIVIRHCKTEHTRGCGILAQGSYGYPWDKKYYISDIIVENNEIHWPQEGYWNGNNIYHEDITFMQGVEYFQILYNYVNAYDSVSYGGGPIGIDVKDGVRYGVIHHNTVENIPANGIYIDAWDTYAHHIDIYQNYVHNVTGQGIQVGAERGGPIDSIKVYNNIVNRSGWSGIASGNYTGGDPPPQPQPKTHIWIFNNTICKAGFRDWGWGILTESSFKQGKIFNNIMVECIENGMKVNKQDDNLISNNCTYKYPPKYDTGDPGDNPVKTDPLFVDAAAGNFRLQSNSPCIDAGLSEGAPAVDFEGTTRPQGAGVDIGAFEYVDASSINENKKNESGFRSYPNPFSGYTNLTYKLKKKSHVKLVVFNTQGVEVAMLVDKDQQPGNYSYRWYPGKMAKSKIKSNLFLCRLQVDNEQYTKKLIIQ